ncbi:cache domain-containing protein [Undibacterium sp. Jales W-56]|uniref:cache domain-containing protein n=1 Tax=Undibacterium sp. Jales W-56 TaxID=2897325 RepID=UPI0021CE3F12|nr:cache domain-containing protein [Undibacterium sp. Jales W-56]MCU6434464.1 cache domain-containing protein [Undibacterium sp. Jales W-56]
MFKKIAAAICAFSFFLCMPVLAAEHGTANEAKAMVQKTIDAMKKSGVQATIAEINKHDGQYSDKDLYVVVYDLNGKNLAHLNPRMIGKDMIDLKDEDGKFFIKERLDIAKKKGSGWQDYKFLNPLSKQIEPKSMYIEKYQDVIVGCGIYK